jgi:hypothetical protein
MHSGIHVIYRVVDTLTGEMYVGSKMNYVHGKYFGSTQLKRAKEIIKARPETLTVQILEIIADPSRLIQREIYWQEKFDVVNSKMYWNQTIAASGFSAFGRKDNYRLGKKHKPETIEKMKISASKVVHKPLTEQHRKNIGTSQIGMKRRPRTNEEKSNHSKIMKGKKFHNRKQYIQTEEHKKNVSISVKHWWDERKKLMYAF